MKEKTILCKILHLSIDIDQWWLFILKKWMLQAPSGLLKILGIFNKNANFLTLHSKFDKMSLKIKIEKRTILHHILEVFSNLWHFVVGRAFATQYKKVLVVK